MVKLHLKEVRIKSRDKPYFTEELQILGRLKMHEYERKEKSERFSHLQVKFKVLLLKEVNKYKDKQKNLQGRNSKDS